MPEGSFVVAWLFVVVHGLLSSCGVQAPGHVGSVVRGTRPPSLRRASSVVVARGLSCPMACGILVPRAGIEPTSPALEGRFFTNGLPEKSPAWPFRGTARSPVLLEEGEKVVRVVECVGSL